MSARPTVPADTVGAFVGAPDRLAEGADGGPLDGVGVAVKDLVDVAGTVTGAGNPTFASERTVAAAHAPVVERLLAAGADVVGKTITDELAYSLSGTNTHYGTPTNVAAPGRSPGGSSAGSAAAVAAGSVDLAVGTDTGGSIRVPASYCGIVGWRPTHGAVPLMGVVPLAPSFDTVGLLARDAALLAVGASVVLDPDAGRTGGPVTGLVLAREALALVGPALAGSLRAGATRAAAALGVVVEEGELGLDLDRALAAFRALQGREAWEVHGAWIEATEPAMGEGIRGRFAMASAVTDEEVAAGRDTQAEVRSVVVDRTSSGVVLVVPSASSAAPAPGMEADAYAGLRQSTLRLTSIAGLAGAPAVGLPLADDDGLPLGVCLIGGLGSDLALLDAAATVMAGR